MPLPIFLPCAAGVEALLEAEVRSLLPEVRVEARRGGVALAGNPREVMLLNLESRLAQRVLIEVAEGEYRSEDDLYALARGVDWGDWSAPRSTSTARASRCSSAAGAATPATRRSRRRWPRRCSPPRAGAAPRRRA